MDFVRFTSKSRWTANNVVKMTVMLVIFSKHLSFINCVKFTLEAVSDLPTLLREGKEQLDLLSSKATEPYGNCWTNAIASLQVGCRVLTQDSQKTLALHLTDCFLEMSSQDRIECDFAKNDCLQSLTDRQFNAYTEFYTHSQNICYFLQSKLWHEQTEQTIDRLSSTSLKVSIQLAEAERGQESLLRQQKVSLELQEAMSRNVLNSKDTIRELRDAAVEHQLALGSLFQQLSAFENWIVGELSWADSVLFYSASLIISCIFTSTHRTRRARLPILLLFTSCYLIEQYIPVIMNDRQSDDSPEHHRVVLSGQIWTLRNIIICLVVLLLAYVSVTFCNYDVVNYEMLVQIKKQNAEIKELLRRSRLDYVTTDNIAKVTDSNLVEMVEGKQDQTINMHKCARSNITEMSWSSEKKIPTDHDKMANLISPRRSRRLEKLQSPVIPS